jgi:hypothetical protein
LRCTNHPLVAICLKTLPFLVVSDLSIAKTVQGAEDTQRQLAALREEKDAEVEGLRTRLAELSQRQGLGESDEDEVRLAIHA